MKTIYSSKHKLHATDNAFYDGQPFITEEVPARADLILKAIGSAKTGEVLPPHDFGLDPILAVHDPEYIDYLQKIYRWNADFYQDDEPVLPHAFAVHRTARKPKSFLGLRGYYGFGSGTPVMEGTWKAAYWAAQCALTAADLVIEGERAVYALCRPPGHHAGPDLYGGSCFLNNAAIAARYLRREADRVAILDIDYHHGNGTQIIFYDDPSVLFCSLHAHPDDDYPYFWGWSDETGAGAGLNTNLNLTLPQKVEDKEYLKTLEKALKKIQSFAPDYLVISVGFDLMKGDPIGGFNISIKGLATISSKIASLRIPSVIVQEGGYLMGEIGNHAATFLVNFNRN
jgi:acetoin utilization deacetylase AcuC-like enzyme